MFSISKEFHFSASHQLHGLPEYHQCSRLHGHNYIVKVTIFNPEVDDVGFIVDYADLAPVKHYIDDKLDHRHLNDVLQFNSTAEQLARHLHGRVWELVNLPKGSQVTVGISETPKTWANFLGDPDHGN